MEASGTGNMKLALNGALTVGTMDGANIEICEHVGRDNVMIFGMTADEVAQRQQARFKGADAVAVSPRLAKVIESLSAGEFSPDEPERFAPIVRSLLGYDRFMVAADFDAYWDAQRSIDRLWQRRNDWWRKAHSQHRAHGLVFVRPHHPRIRHRHLARAGRLSRICAPASSKARATRRRPSCALEFLEIDRQLARPVRMLVGGAGDIDLLGDAEDILQRHHHQPRRRRAKQLRDRGEIFGRVIRRAFGQNLAQRASPPDARFVVFARDRCRANASV